MQQYLWLVPVGFIVGGYGTLIGAGGGFVLMPLLLLLYPHESPQVITSISLAVVFFNALSGSVAYGRMGRIDYQSGILFSLATIPGAILGALTTAYIPRRVFDAMLGVLMVTASIALILRPHRGQERKGKGIGNGFSRHLVEKDGTVHRFSYNPQWGVGGSLVVGYFSSLLGIGGGIIHVPILVQFLDFPIHIATATSHFTLASMTLAATLVHISTGAFHHGIRRTICLAVGVLPGAQFGAWFSRRVQGVWIIRGLAIALGVVGLRIIAMVLQG